MTKNTFCLNISLKSADLLIVIQFRKCKEENKYTKYTEKKIKGLCDLELSTN